MRAMLLTAGVGERMLPLTRNLPKPAIPVLGRPLAVQILEQLARCGVDRAVLNLFHRGEALRDLLKLKDGPNLGLPSVRFSHEESLLGTGGGLRKAGTLLRGEGPLLVSNGDFLSDIDLEAAVRQHRRSDCLATLVLAPPREGLSRVDVDASGRVVSLAGLPQVDPGRVRDAYLFTGCHVMDEEVLDLIPETTPSCIVRDVYRDLAAAGRLGSYVHRGFWWEFGSPEQYLEGSLVLLDESRRRGCRVTPHDPLRRVDRAVAAVGAGAKIDPGAHLIGRVALGFASHVSRGTTLEDTVVMPESWVGPDCRLRRSVVGPGVELPADFEAERALICPDSDPAAPLDPATERVDGLLIYRLRG